MAAIFNSDILVFPHKLTHTCQDWFQPFPKKKTSLTLPSPLFAQKNFTHSFWLNLMMAAILTSAILNCAILDSAILVFPLKVTHTCQDWFPPFAPKKLNSYFPLHQLHKKTSLIHSDSMWWWQPSWILSPWIQPFCTKNFTHSFWLNLVMAAILNSAMLDSDTAILDSDTLLTSLRFTQKHSHSTLTLTQTNSI